mmetsp:Transcript_50280/g.130571  ORF Transcript_50280/g.130571 Transcript_50280/m.130571 type:complete len:237 (+) Transcript_50280:974-1684(+)
MLPIVVPWLHNASSMAPIDRSDAQLARAFSSVEESSCAETLELLSVAHGYGPKQLAERIDDEFSEAFKFWIFVAPEVQLPPAVERQEALGPVARELLPLVLLLRQERAPLRHQVSLPGQVDGLSARFLVLHQQRLLHGVAAHAVQKYEGPLTKHLQHRHATPLLVVLGHPNAPDWQQHAVLFRQRGRRPLGHLDLGDVVLAFPDGLAGSVEDPGEQTHRSNGIRNAISVSINCVNE